MTNRFRTLAVAAAMLLPSVAFAQTASTRPFGRGSRIGSVGVLTGGNNYEGVGLGASFEVGMKEFTPTLSLGIGAMAGFVRGNYGLFSNVTVTAIPVMAIGNVHLAIASQPKLDLYAGLSAGINRYSYSFDNAIAGFNGASDSQFGIGVQVGARYAFTERAMGFAQVGASDIPLLYAGLSFRF
jgi:hypothetical protein